MENPDFESSNEFLFPETSEKDEEFGNFLSRVDEISQIISGLSSEDEKEQERALRRADILLHHAGDSFSDDSQINTKVGVDRTVINNVKNECGDGGGMAPDAFMRMVEKDAEKRASEKRQRKEEADKLRTKGNIAFRKENYAEALDSYNKAINLVRDSVCLYTNRALTYMRVGVCSKALEDCEKAIKLNENSVKARLLKARALFGLTLPNEAKTWLEETKALFPNQLPMIKKYETDLFDLKMCPGSQRKREGSAGKSDKKDEPFSRLHDLTDAEAIWRKAARHECGQDENQK